MTECDEGRQNVIGRLNVIRGRQNVVVGRQNMIGGWEIRIGVRQNVIGDRQNEWRPTKCERVQQNRIGGRQNKILIRGPITSTMCFVNKGNLVL